MQSLSCIKFDIYDFEKINDIHGNRAGDFILIELVSLIKKIIMESDIFTSCGGEEFLILLPHNELESLVKIRERIRTLVESHNFYWKRLPLKITLNLGAPLTGSTRINSRAALLEVADSNLLKTKKQWGDCVSG